MRQRTAWLSGIILCCAMGLIGCARNSETTSSEIPTKFYDKHFERAYDASGQVRYGYGTLNLDYLDAIDADLKACYARKKP